MRTWWISDLEAQLWRPGLRVGPEDVAPGSRAAWSITHRELRGGPADGVEVVRVDNGALAYEILPTRGMGLWRGRYRGLDLGWRSPVRGPVHPRLVDLGARGGLGWLTGFDEMIVRCGLDSNGAPATDVVTSNQGEPVEVELTLHGRIANTPASKVGVSIGDGDQPELAVHGEVHECGLFLPDLQLDTRIVTTPGSNRLRIEDTIVNRAATSAELELLYHCNFGPPFLGAGARLEIPHALVAPRDARAASAFETRQDYAGPTTGFVEEVYWYEPLADATGACVAALVAPARDAAVAVRFDVAQLPAFTQWKNTAAETDGYVTGLEPGTDYPNARAFERAQGRLAVLEPGERRASTLEIEVHGTPGEVESLLSEIRAIQGGVTPVAHPQPLTTHSP